LVVLIAFLPTVIYSEHNCVHDSKFFPPPFKAKGTKG